MKTFFKKLALAIFIPRLFLAISILVFSLLILFSLDNLSFLQPVKNILDSETLSISINEDNYSVYELVSEDHHDHMVCMDSGKVIEFKNDLIEKEQEKIAKKYGYKIVDHKLVLYVKPLDEKE